MRFLILVLFEGEKLIEKVNSQSIFYSRKARCDIGSLSSQFSEPIINTMSRACLLILGLLKSKSFTKKLIASQILFSSEGSRFGLANKICNICICKAILIGLINGERLINRSLCRPFSLNHGLNFAEYLHARIVNVSYISYF